MNLQGWKGRQLPRQGCAVGNDVSHTAVPDIGAKRWLLYLALTRSPLPSALLSLSCRASHGASEPGNVQDPCDFMDIAFSFSFVNVLYESKKCSPQCFHYEKSLDSVKLSSLSADVVTHALCPLLIRCFTLVDAPLTG